MPEPKKRRTYYKVTYVFHKGVGSGKQGTLGWWAYGRDECKKTFIEAYRQRSPEVLSITLYFKN